MKKLFTILFLVLGICTPTYAKVKTDLTIGLGQKEVIKAIGKPTVITYDSDEYETWVYEDISAIPSSNCSNFGGVNSNRKNTTLIIKFDSNQNILNISYHKSTF